MPKVTVCDTGRQYNEIVGNRYACSVSVFDKYTFLILVDTRNLAKDYSCILLFPENIPDRRAYLRRSEHCRGHLIEQRLEQMMIRAVNQDDFRRSVLEGLSGR